MRNHLKSKLSPAREWLLAVFLMLGMGAAFSLQAADATSPEEQVKQTVDGVLAALKDKSLSDQQRHEKIAGLIGARFNFEFMGQSILAVNWKNATPEQRARFVELFRKLLENTYVVAVESYQGETVRVAKEKLEEKRATVDTFIVQPNREIPVTYKFRLGANGWYGYDVVIEGVSMISNYRNSFRSMVARDGMDGLISSLEKKLGTPAG